MPSRLICIHKSFPSSDDELESITANINDDIKGTRITFDDLIGGTDFIFTIPSDMNADETDIMDFICDSLGSDMEDI